MDLENKALKEAFNKKYGGIKTDEKDFERFAKKYYGKEPKKEEPSLLDKAKYGLKEWYEFNFGSGPESRGSKAK